MAHTSVLLQESIDALRLTPSATVLDGTFGGGGHSRLIAEHIAPSGKLVAFDRDASVFRSDIAEEIRACVDFHPVVGNFRESDRVLDELGVEKIDAALFDLGLSSTELEVSGRGFSFQKDEPLLMTFEESPAPGAVTARLIVNSWSEESIADILYGFGEERYARRIARAIVSAREERPIERTGDLVAIIHRATPAIYHRGRTHFATRTFQALRIAVNDELGSIAEGIPAAIERLRPGGRIAVITFHSLEDRAVKRIFRKAADKGEVELVSKKPLVPSDQEIKRNPRARSAKLRIAEKV